MKKINNKGAVTAEILAVLFVPGAIPVLLSTLCYKNVKKLSLKKSCKNYN